MRRLNIDAAIAAEIHAACGAHVIAIRRLELALLSTDALDISVAHKKLHDSKTALLRARTRQDLVRDGVIPDDLK